MLDRLHHTRKFKAIITQQFEGREIFGHDSCEDNYKNSQESMVLGGNLCSSPG